MSKQLRHSIKIIDVILKLAEAKVNFGSYSCHSTGTK
jgi:hypothetical protein